MAVQMPEQYQYVKEPDENYNYKSIQTEIQTLPAGMLVET